MSILTEYSIGLLPLCLLLGAGYAFLLYYKNRSIDYEKKPRYIMFALRGMAISLITFLLLAPMIRTVTKKKEKPIIILAVDNSESILLTKDSAYYLNKFNPEVEKLAQSLGGKYDVKTYCFGEKNVLAEGDDAQKSDFTHKNTNISSLFDEIDETYAFQNVGAVVLMSDGIYNQGENPYYKAQRLKFPIHTVGLGSDEQQIDLAITGINHNSKTYQGNMFPVEVKVLAMRLAGKRSTLTVSYKDKVLYTKEINIGGKKHFETVKFLLEAGKRGVYKYKVTLSEVDGEITTKNNVSSFFVEVVDSKEKVAIVYNAPHPDVSAVSQALESSDKYQVEAIPVQDFHDNIEQYSLVILHQLPSNKFAVSNMLERAKKSRTSLLFVLGSETNLSAFNALNCGVKISTNKHLTNDAMPYYNNNFSTFTFSEESKHALKTFPPLQTLFGDYLSAISTNTFLFQRISGVETQYPLVAFNEVNGVKMGVIAGTGLWQWRLYNYLYEQNHDAFNEVIGKIVLYLSAKNDRSQFKVLAPDVVDENRDVEFDAELYNDSYELITDPDVAITVVGENNIKYTAQFSKQGNGYHLNLGRLPVGDYTWNAITEYNGKKLVKTGLFSIHEVMIESINLVADHQLLQSIAKVSHGQYFEKEKMQSIADVIKSDPNITTISSYEKNYNMLLDKWWYFVILILLLGAEWFMRKWHGGY